jgi:hypothetical protein
VEGNRHVVTCRSLPRHLAAGHCPGGHERFFASIEQRDRPEWRGRPVAITNGRQGTCIITCSYEARAYGIKTGMRLKQARRLCPELIQCPARPERYAATSTAIMEALQDVTSVMWLKDHASGIGQLTGATGVRFSRPCDYNSGLKKNSPHYKIKKNAITWTICSWRTVEPPETSAGVVSAVVRHRAVHHCPVPAADLFHHAIPVFRLAVYRISSGCAGGGLFLSYQ